MTRLPQIHTGKETLAGTSKPFATLVSVYVRMSFQQSSLLARHLSDGAGALPTVRKREEVMRHGEEARSASVV